VQLFSKSVKNPAADALRRRQVQSLVPIMCTCRASVDQRVSSSIALYTEERTYMRNCHIKRGISLAVLVSYIILRGSAKGTHL